MELAKTWRCLQLLVVVIYQINALTNYEVRLLGGRVGSEGRIAIKKDEGKWGSVCDDKFDKKDADVFCKMMGFYLGSIEANYHKQFGTGDESDPIWVDDLDCPNGASHLDECEIPDGWGQGDCYHGEDVGVTCIPLHGGFTEVQLVNGAGPHEGRVQVRVMDDLWGGWGTVCNHQFTMREANVICRMLGYRNAVRTGVSFGSGSGSIWLDNVQCPDNATDLRQCTHGGWGIHSCSHDDDVGVICNTGQKITFKNTCPSDFTVKTGPCEQFARVTYQSPRAFDSTSMVPVYPQENFPILLPPGVHTREFTATSRTGQEATCSFTITVTATMCSPPPVPAGGMVMSLTCQQMHGSVATYACDSRRMIRGNKTMVCNEKGQWAGVRPQCSQMSCEGLTRTIPNGDISPSVCKQPMVPAGTICSVECDDGYATQGPQRTRCTAQQTWEHNIYTSPCKVNVVSFGYTCPSNMNARLRRCEDKATIFYTMPTATDFSGLVPVHPVEKLPVLLPSGVHSRNFSAVSRSGQKANCFFTITIPPNTCPDLDVPENGYILSQACGILYGSIITFACEDKYILEGNRTRRCDDTREWSGAQPTCRPAQCPRPLDDVANGGISPSICKHDDISAGTTCKVHCKDGFSLEGDAESICTASEVWDVDLRSSLCKVNEVTFGNSCPDDMTVTPDQCREEYNVALHNPTASDPHGVVPVYPVGYLPASLPVGTHIRRYKATSNNGQTAFCAFNITVEPSECPNPDELTFQDTCPENLTIYTNECQDFAVADYRPIAYDSSGPVLVVPEKNYPVLLPIGVHTRTFTATGKTGRVVKCSFNITVNSIQCPVLTVPRNGILMSQTCKLLRSSVATFDCEYPYRLNGSRYMTCNSDGEWDSDIPVCRKPSCAGLVTTAQHATISPPLCASEEVPVETECRLVCEDGYSHIGPEEAECTREGTWDVDILHNVCVENKISFNGTCPDLMTVYCESCETIAQVTYNIPVAFDSFGSVPVTPQENLPILLPPGVHTRNFIATSSGGQVAKCSFNITVLTTMCSEPDVPNNVRVISKSCGNRYGSVVAYGCDYPYTLNGQISTQCEADGSWSNAPPVCETSSTCVGLNTLVNHGDIYPDLCKESSVPVGTTCTVRCQNRYRLSGSSSVTCNTDGNWSGQLRQSACTDNTITFGDTCPNQMVVQLEPCEKLAQIIYAQPAAWDAEGSIRVYPKEHFPVVLPAGTHTRMFTATGRYGQMVICSFNVIVRPTKCPHDYGDDLSISCPSNMTVKLKQCEEHATVFYTGPTIRGLDKSKSINPQEDQPMLLPHGVHTKMFTAVSSSGKLATCFFNITVLPSSCSSDEGMSPTSTIAVIILAILLIFIFIIGLALVYSRHVRKQSLTYKVQRIDSQCDDEKQDIYKLDAPSQHSTLNSTSNTNLSVEAADQRHLIKYNRYDHLPRESFM